MREHFAQRLNELEARIDAELRNAVSTLHTVGEAVLAPAPSSTREITAAGHGLRQASRGIDGDLVTIVALQSPVATDLRRVMAMAEVAHHIELIGNQFLLIGDELADIDPSVPDRAGCGRRLAEMADLASRQLTDAAAIDTHNREVFKASLESDETRPERELSLRHLLIARSLERIGDNAVDIAEQAVFLVTAELCEFSDASHPRAAA